MLEKEKSHVKDDPKELEMVQTRFEKAIPRICVALGKVDAMQAVSWDDYWDVATAIELAQLAQQWEMGITAMRALVKHTDRSDAKGSLETTFKQQRELLATLKEHLISTCPSFGTRP